jgi:isopenicillin N synthase-like dioxygenase
MLRRWTNHRFASALHRVVNLPGQQRYAVPLFWVPRPSALMEALPTCSDAANPPRYGPITSGDFMRGWYAGEYTSMRTLTPAQVQVIETDPGGLLR